MRSETLSRFLERERGKCIGRRLLIGALMVGGLSAFAESLAVWVEMMGTWRLSTAKSKYVGVPMPKQMTATYTLEGTGWRFEASGISSTGEPVRMSYTYVKDGAEISTTGFPYWDTIIIDRGAAREGSATMKRHGIAVGQMTRSISADAKTLTIHSNVTTPEGNTVSWVAVYEKE